MSHYKLQLPCRRFMIEKAKIMRKNLSVDQYESVKFTFMAFINQSILFSSD